MVTTHTCTKFWVSTSNGSAVRALHRHTDGTDFIPSTADTYVICDNFLKNIMLHLIAPCQIMINQDDQASTTKYVRGGGHGQ